MYLTGKKTIIVFFFLCSVDGLTIYSPAGNSFNGVAHHVNIKYERINYLSSGSVFLLGVLRTLPQMTHQLFYQCFKTWQLCLLITTLMHSPGTAS